MKLSIVIVSYNTKKDLKNCLTSVKNCPPQQSHEIIVIDNDSKDGSPQMVKKDFPQVKLIKSGGNLGFGKANNLGAVKAKGEYLLFLNPDTLVHKDSLTDALEQAENKYNLGAFTCKLTFKDTSTQPSGGYFPTLFRLLAWHTALDEIPLLKRLIGPIHPPANFYQKSFNPDWITGAFMIIPKTVFKKVKGFDENIFMYGEELELCYRVRKEGYNIYYSNTPTITHLQSKSSSSTYALIKEYEGIIYFFKKHKPKWQLPFAIITFKLGALLRLLLFGIIMGNDNKKDAYTKILKS